MTPHEALVRRIALSQGLNPELAMSLWQQESGRSTDTGLLGQALSRGRGRAVGPWQVVPYYHPDFPVGGSFEDQTRYALGYLKDVGPAGYYGTGQAPAGHPTTEEYVSQVMSRVPGASAGTGEDSMNIPAMPPLPGLPAPPAPPAMAPMDPMTQMLMDPVLALGLGMMSSAISGNDFGTALQAGMLGGVGSAMALQQMRQGEADRQYDYQRQRYEYDVAQADLAREQARQEQIRQATAGLSLTPLERAQEMINPGSGIASAIERTQREPAGPELETITGPGGQKITVMREPGGEYVPVEPQGGWTPVKPTLKDIKPWYDAAQKEVQPLVEAASEARKLETTLNSPGPFSDVAAIFASLKALDPSSVVRESETEMLQAALPLWQKLMSDVSKIGAGGLVPAPVREDMRRTFSSLMDIYRADESEIMRKWRKFGAARNMDPELDLGLRGIDFPTFEPPQRNLPAEIPEGSEAGYDQNGRPIWRTPDGKFYAREE